MKKLVVRILIALVVLVLLAVLAASLFLDGAVKRGVESYGPKFTKVEVKLGSVSLSLIAGSGKMTKLVVGNPEGYKTPAAINMGTASLALNSKSLLSDKIVVKSINVQGPEITFETDFKISNLKKILANLEETTGGGEQGGDRAKQAQTTQGKAGRKLEVDDMLISGGKIHVSITSLAGKSATIPLPEIHLTDLGKGPEGITGAELAKIVLAAIEKEAAKGASGAVADLEKSALSLTKDLGPTGTNAVKKASKTISDWLKK